MFYVRTRLIPPRWTFTWGGDIGVIESSKECWEQAERITELCVAERMEVESLCGTGSPPTFFPRDLLETF